MKDKSLDITIMRLQREIRKLKREKLLLEKRFIDQGRKHKHEIKMVMETIASYQMMEDDNSISPHLR